MLLTFQMFNSVFLEIHCLTPSDSNALEMNSAGIVGGRISAAAGVHFPAPLLYFITKSKSGLDVFRK